MPPVTTDPVAALAACIAGEGRVVVLSGAGMSAESGVPAFRDAQTGLWEHYDPADLATPEAWESDPAGVWAWYVWRMRLVRDSEPNAGHRALARLAGSCEVDVITQNVDDLHERAGSRVLAHLHGSLFQSRCEGVGHPYDADIDLPDEPVAEIDPPSCPECGLDVRPGVVWFGEMLPSAEVDASITLLESLGPTDVVLVAGTSGVVYPAAGFPAMARATGALVVEVNPEATDISDVAHVHLRGPSGNVLPRLVDDALARCGPQRQTSRRRSMRTTTTSIAASSIRYNTR